MNQMLWGKPTLTDTQRQELTNAAIGLAIERNGIVEVMAKCVIVRSYRELWVLDPTDYPRGQRII